MYYMDIQICNALHELMPFVQFNKGGNTHGGVLLLACMGDFYVF